MFGIVLIPDRKVINHTIQMSKQVPGNLLSLDDSIVLPHLTVLQAPIVSSFNYDEALDLFRDYVGFSYEPKTQIGELYQQGSYIMLQVNNAKWLSDFNRLTVEYTSAHIEIPSIPNLDKFENKAQLESFKATGYKRNLDAYEPHITVGVAENNTVLPENSLENSYARLRYLAYAEHGKNGTIKKIISSRELPMTWN